MPMTIDDWWPAPTARELIDATVRVPGSKSVTNRALILAALADGPSTIRQALDARDTRLMTRALQSLGVGIESASSALAGNADVHVSPGTLTGPASIDVGLAGTVMRFVPPVAALAHGDVHFDGDAQARHRPMSATLASLRALGVHIDAEGSSLPFTVHGSGHVPGGEVSIDASASSQFLSALLLVGARYDRGVTVRHVGAPIPSQPHIDMTIAMLREHGVTVDDTEPDVWRVAATPILARDRIVEPDLSNAAPFLAAAMVAGGRVTIADWPEHTTQPGDRLRDLLAVMGAEVRWTPDGLTVSMDDEIHGLDADLHDVGELAPTLAALAALATTPSHLFGIAHLRGHETDRLAAIATEISRLGGLAEQTDDGLRIRPARLHGGRFRTYADHRMATAGAIIGLRVPDVEVQDIATTDKTLPDFAHRWVSLVS